MSQQENKNLAKCFYRASASDFYKIPSSPIAYWMSDAQVNLFLNKKISEYGKVGVGLQTGNNSQYIRYWFEVNFHDINCHENDTSSEHIWYKCNKGGEYRKWYGNGLDVILWKNNGAALKKKCTKCRNKK
ncbi:BREX-1 system adenine-specific DNA-methyltransferase PglX [Buttiauxella izardii]|uniref:BREX-1 system adenine-specific DNA-methyltransferase PglX n=1 Tax=Buttiauxella izardii TaxID=82991 RepID=UPI001FC8FA75|nr:BREX-1 system adenine-specific DNA-methyltransferase PglX [Buttiauxella izardii]